MRCILPKTLRQPVGRLLLLTFLLGGFPGLWGQPTPGGQDLTAISLEELAQVKVFTASRHLEYSEDAPSSVTIITASDIVAYGWRTLADVLRSVRGFYTSYDRDYSYLGVRGFQRSGDYNSRILLMINGHRLNDQLYDSAQIGTEFPLDLDLIDHIEIVRGPSSSMFGTNAFFGVINVITRLQRSHKTFQITGDAASFLSRSGAITAGVEENRRSLLVSGSMYRSAGQGNLYYPDFSSTDGGFARDADGDRYDHAFADAQVGNFRLEGLFSDRIKQIPTAPYGTIFNDPRARSQDERWYLDLGYQRSLSATTDLDFRTYYDSAYSLGTGAFADPEASNGILGYTRGRADWVGAEANLGRQFGKHRLTLGAEYNGCLRVDQQNYYVGGGTPTLVIADHETPSQVAGYAQAELHFVPKFTLDIGGRLDWFDTFGQAFSPRIAAIYKLDAKTSLKYIFGRAFRAPNAYESYYYDLVVIGEPNPHLQPENIQTQEVVLERRLLPWMQLTTDGFYNGLKNLIDEAPDPENGLTHFVNIGRDTGRGFEIELEAKRASGLSARGSYTLADARNNYQSQRLASSPLHTAKLNVAVPLLRKLTGAAELLYTSPQESYQDARVSPALLANLTFSTKPMFGGWQLSSSCYNVFNRTWYAPAGPELRQSQILQDGRTFRIKLTYSLPAREARSKP